MIPLMKNAFLNEYETRKELSEFILHAQKLSMDEQCYNFEKNFLKLVIFRYELNFVIQSFLKSY